MTATTKVAHPPYNGASFDGKKYRTVFESGLAAFNGRRASLTMWDSGTGQRVEWEIHRDGKPHEVVMASPEPRLQPRDLNLQSAVYVKDREDLACFGLDWKQRPVCKTALLAHLEEAWHAPFQSLLLSSLRAGSRWRGILAYVDAPDLSCQREELYRLQQFVAIASSESDLFEIVSHIVRADERRRIARDLHDGVMQSLIATEIRLAMLTRDSLATAGSPDSALKDAHELLRREIRNLKVQMEDLHQGGTSEVISRKCEELLTNFQCETHIATTFRCDLDQARICPQMGYELSCLLSESLSNIRRHSRAKHVAIEIGMHDGLRLTVQDDGCGCDFAGHFNLAQLLQMAQAPQSICRRVRALGGDLVVDSSAESGTRLEMWLPLYALDDYREDTTLDLMHFRNQGARGRPLRRPARSVGSNPRSQRQL